MEESLNDMSPMLIITQTFYLLFAVLMVWLLIKAIRFFTLKNRELKKNLNKE